MTEYNPAQYGYLSTRAFNQYFPSDFKSERATTTAATRQDVGKYFKRIRFKSCLTLILDHQSNKHLGRLDFLLSVLKSRRCSDYPAADLVGVRATNVPSQSNKVASKQLTTMRRMTRSQSRLMCSQTDEVGVGKRASFSNLTNLKSPKRTGKRQKTAHKSIQQPDEAQAVSATQSSVSQSQSTLGSQLSLSQQPVSAQNGELLQTLQTLRKVLENDFSDVSRRLQLPMVPSHLYKSCHSNAQLHFAPAESVYVAKNYFTEDRHVEFISLVAKSMCGQKQFPGALVARCILETILKISEENSFKFGMSVQQTLVDLHSLFTSILSSFPTIPYRADYLKLFETRFNVAWLKTSSTSQGILHFMLELCSDLIHRGDFKKTKKLPKETDKMNNFFYWDAQNEENFCFDNFPREEKFERIFLVLDLLVRVLEDDLAMFVVKYSSKLQTCINNKSLCPLACLVLWESHESVNILNALTKNLITTFVTMIGLRYPKGKITVIARLLNLISHVLNLHEYPDLRFDRYPIYGNKTTDLVREIQKTVENSVFYSMDLITDVAEHIRSPLLQMLFVVQMLKKITGADQPISLEVPCKLILNKDFEKFDDIPRTSVPKLETYPPYDAQVEVRRAVVTQRSFLKLLEVYVAAFNVYYCIQSGFKALHKQKPEEVKVAAETATFTFADFEQRVTTANKLDESVQPRQVNSKRLVSIKISRECYLFFQSEIKHLVALVRLIKKCHEKFGSKFEDFKRLTETMEA